MRVLLKTFDADNTIIKRKRGKNKVPQRRWRRKRDNLKYCQEFRTQKVEELKIAIQDKSYINQAIDSLAEGIACQWIQEKYGKGDNKCL